MREEVKVWRGAGYAGASGASRGLLAWWPHADHPIKQANGTQSRFRHYFTQREAVETIAWFCDVRGARDKCEPLRFGVSGAVSVKRFIVEMAAGAGTTKALSLLVVWIYFHRLHEPDSTLARNLLLIVPNVIALDHIEYVKVNGELSACAPDFIARTTDSKVWIVETKGREEIELPQKMARLGHWCEDAIEAARGDGGPSYRLVCVDKRGFEKYKPNIFAALAASFTDYQEVE